MTDVEAVPDNHYEDGDCLPIYDFLWLDEWLLKNVMFDDVTYSSKVSKLEMKSQRFTSYLW